MKTTSLMVTVTDRNEIGDKNILITCRECAHSTQIVMSNPEDMGYIMAKWFAHTCEDGCPYSPGLYACTQCKWIFLCHAPNRWTGALFDEKGEIFKADGLFTHTWEYFKQSYSDCYEHLSRMTLMVNPKGGHVT